jgi:hypothetical protein
MADEKDKVEAEKVGVDDRFAGLKGKRFDFNAVERRCLELELAPAERMRREAARIELRALLAARAFAVERLGLPEDCQVKIVRESGVPVAIEVVEPHAPPGEKASA